MPSWLGWLSMAGSRSAGGAEVMLATTELVPDDLQRRQLQRLDLQCGRDGKLIAGLVSNSQDEFVSIFGDVRREFADQALQDLLNVALTAAPKPGPVDTLTINALLQAVAGLRPC